MVNYAEDKEISAKWFGGETIPHANTINKKRHIFICELAQRLVNRKIGATEDQTDVNGLLKDAFLDFYGRELKGQKLLLDEDLEGDLIGQFASPAFTGILKSEKATHKR